MKLNALYYLAMLTLACCFVVGAYIWTLIFLPYTFWFEYTSVEPITYEFSIEERPTLVSTRNVYRPVHMSWDDTLRCNFDNDDYGSTHISQYKSSGIVQPEENATAPWIYQAIGPTEAATCYIDSVVSVTLPFGIVKSQTLESGPFHFYET